ncbi:Carrier protein, mitochondrial [Coemansia biformis]|uniref:Carrier protein, mitochondrial n=1 Tax=Coemansia biformis TaxID=1286918 RepID=A0A9W7YG13_9FUNG|nr:Carrier protein, mitochondrial [Coemansia biformis]
MTISSFIEQIHSLEASMIRSCNGLQYVPDKLVIDYVSEGGENKLDIVVHAPNNQDGAVVTSLLMTPFDVVKTRQQSQTLVRANAVVPREWSGIRPWVPRSARHLAESSPSLYSCRCDTKSAKGLLRRLDLRATASLCLCPDPASGSGELGKRTTFFTASTGAGRVAEAWRQLYSGLQTRGWQATQAGSLAVPATRVADDRIKGTLAGMRHIAHNEGLRTLWRGLTPTLVASGPSTVIYFVGYDYLRQWMGRQMRSRSSVAPYEKYASLVAGCTARTFAATAISPLELVRTRVQASPAHNVRSVLADISHEIRGGGVRILWRGLVPTLWRDVPFSAIYWFGYERWREDVYEPLFAQQLAAGAEADMVSRLAVAFCSGASSGAVAAAVTMPFDVAKTRRQIEHYTSSKHQQPPRQSSLAHVVRQIMVAEGPRGLFAGLAPRLMKVVPSCAIMISSYELGKLMLGH